MCDIEERFYIVKRMEKVIDAGLLQSFRLRSG